MTNKIIKLFSKLYPKEVREINAKVWYGVYMGKGQSSQFSTKNIATFVKEYSILSRKYQKTEQDVRDLERLKETLIEETLTLLMKRKQGGLNDK